MALIVLLLAGCGTTTTNAAFGQKAKAAEAAKVEAAAAKAKDVANAAARVEARAAEAKLRKSFDTYIKVGMPSEFVTKWMSGHKPTRITSSVGSFGRHEQWVYEFLDLYVYVVNGKVSSWTWLPMRE